MRCGQGEPGCTPYQSVGVPAALLPVWYKQDKGDHQQRFTTFIQNNPGRVWILGNEHGGGHQAEDPSQDNLTNGEYVRFYRDYHQFIAGVDSTAQFALGGLAMETRKQPGDRTSVDNVIALWEEVLTLYESDYGPMPIHVWNIHLYPGTGCGDRRDYRDGFVFAIARFRDFIQTTRNGRYYDAPLILTEFQGSYDAGHAWNFRTMAKTVQFLEDFRFDLEDLKDWGMLQAWFWLLSTAPDNDDKDPSKPHIYISTRLLRNGSLTALGREYAEISQCWESRDRCADYIIPDEYLVGDWNGDGKDKLALRRGNEVFMNYDFDRIWDQYQRYGRGKQESQYLVGDWDGDGRDNLAVRRGDEIFLDTNFDGKHDIYQRFRCGSSADQYLVGDWNKDGKATLAVRCGDEIFMNNNFDDQYDLYQRFGYGNREDQYLAGDWDGDGKTNIALRRGSEIFMDTNFDGKHDLYQVFGLGNSEDQYLAGDWNGDGRDKLAVRRGNLVLMNHNFDGTDDFRQKFGRRPPADSGAGMSREERLVRNYYRWFLAWNDPPAGDVKWHVNNLIADKGNCGPTIRRFARSDGFLQGRKAGPKVELVFYMFRALLGRNIDLPGYESWLPKSRDQIVDGIAATPEAAAACAGGRYFE